MSKIAQNINRVAWQEGENARGERWRYLDLSGEHLGVRIEEIPPGGSTSVHHFHTLEEEHVLILQGVATLILGTTEHTLEEGDHIWFAAGKEQAHHIENRSEKNFKFLVFGERLEGDLVIYPENEVMLVKALDNRRYRFKSRD